MTERRPVTESEKQTILDRDGKFCFVDGHPIESEEDLHFDHIRPIAEGGSTTVENLAPVCRKHIQRKGKQSLSEYRDQLGLEAFFRDGSAKYLDQVITAKGMRSGTKLQHKVSSSGEEVNLVSTMAKRKCRCTSALRRAGSTFTLSFP